MLPPFTTVCTSSGPHYVLRKGLVSQALFCQTNNKIVFFFIWVKILAQ